MRTTFVILLFAVACTKSSGTQSIGAVCMRAKEIASRADAERVQVVTMLAEKGDPIRLAARCEGSRHLDRAVQDVYSIILDAQLVTTDRWTPMSESIRKLAATTDACTAIENGGADAMEALRAWHEEMRTKHEAAYQACRALQR